MTFKKIDPTEIPDNPFKLIEADWMLITAGKKDSFNMMTANWGGIGHLWNKYVVFCFVRPTRYTYRLMNSSDMFTVSIFDEKYRKELNICGEKSGRDINKVAETGFTPVETDNAIYFEEARLVFVCKKIYYQDISPDKFVDPQIDKLYSKKDYHRMYIGEIKQILTKQ